MVRRWLRGALGALWIVAVVCSPALASDSYSWGAYGADYGRARRSSVPQSVAATDGLYATPWVVPDPNPGDESQSTPVVVAGSIYFFAFASSTEGALYENDLSGTGPGAAREIVSFRASRYEQYTSPGDPSVSPDGKWLAYAAGMHLYWWRVGHWGRTNRGPIPNAANGGTAYVSSAPLFVGDNRPGSGGWDVCSGSGDGGFACFQTASGMPTNVPAYTTHGSPITSSAVALSDSQVCFGVAAPAPRARIVCLDPHGSLVRDGLGAGRISAPVDTALTYAGTAASDASLYFTDRVGDVYRMDPATGAILAEDRATSDGATSIAPVAVDGESDMAFAVARGYGAVCGLNAATLTFYGGSFGDSCTTSAARVPGGGAAGAFTAATAVPVATATCQGDMVWDATDGGVVVASGVCAGQRRPVVAFAAPDGTSRAHNFSAVVVGVGPGDAYAVLWSDTAVTCWVPGGSCARNEGPPAGFAGPHGSAGGGLEVWRLRPPLTAWFEANPAQVPAGGGVPSGGECLLALATPGEFGRLTATLPGGVRLTLHTRAWAVGDAARRTGPLFGRRPPGCPPPQTTSDYWESLDAQWNASGPAGSYPGMVDRRGTPPGRFGTYQLWWVTDVAAPGGTGGLRTVVTGTAADGAALSVRPTLYLTCTAGDQAGPGGRCLPPPPALPAGTPPGAEANPPQCGGQAACPPEPQGPWMPILVCGGPIACNTDFPGSQLPGQFLPEPCDPAAPAGDPNRCPGSGTNP